MKTTNRGSALLAVLWLSAALAAIAFSVSTTVRAETDRVSTAADGLRASYLATGSVERAIQWMLWGSDYRRTDGSAFWEYTQQRMTMSFPSGDAIVELIPESAKLNINTASPDDILRVRARRQWRARPRPPNHRCNRRLAQSRQWIRHVRSVLLRHRSDFPRPACVF